MKKIGIILGFVFCLLFSVVNLSGCASVSRPLLDYQNNLSSVSADFETCGAKYRIEITYTENGAELEIKEPENISGVKFIKEGEAAFGQSGDVKIPLSPELFSKIEPVFDAFSLLPEKIASISKDESGNTVYTVSSENGVYTVIIGAEALPISIGYEGERSFEIYNILLKKIT